MITVLPEAVPGRGPVRIPGDDVALAAVLRVARDHRDGGWDEMEPALAASWERLRRPTSPEWKDVADRVRACCEQAGRRTHA